MVSKVGLCIGTRAVAQLAEQSFQAPDILGSNPVVGLFLIEHSFSVNCIRKTKIKRKEAGTSPFKNLY